MTRQSKNARNLARARAMSAQRTGSGEKGPARTTPLHGKRWTYRSNPAVQKAMAEMIKATQQDHDKTAGRKILAKAGGASKE